LLEKPSHLKEIWILVRQKQEKVAQEKMQKIYEKIGL
ncbi:tryptophan--tRNA ligase, partial [Campylobacter jejuni]|nr:tryptophan--tRNA ligase [Campylobacter jejuni]